MHTCAKIVPMEQMLVQTTSWVASCSSFFISPAIMAGQMKNDEQLATQLVVWTSICSIGTVFAQVCILMQAGILVI